MLKIAVLGDIHLGSKRNRTLDIIEHLNKAFPDNSETADLDIIILEGDVFDDLLDMSSELIPSIDLWIDRLLRICAKHDILLRVLEGTPSHDWKQSERFNTIKKINKASVDFKYVDTLSIEFIPKFGINILYVPDEWDSSTDSTLSQVKELMASKNLLQVDYAVMHGNFNYQLTQAAKHAPRHDEEAYLNLVKHLIFIGHIHTASNYQRIYASGSFERLSHGEEEPKGHTRAIVYDDGTYHVSFIENELARKYVTIDCGDRTTDELFFHVKQIVSPLPDDSCIRIRGKSSHPVMQDMASLIRLYPTLVWTKLVKDDDDEEIEETIEEVTFTPITIDKSNIQNLLLSRLHSDVTISSEVIENATNHLKELI